jgi:integrase
MAGMSYMQRRKSGIYEFRKRLPTSLAGVPCPDHLKIELGELVNPQTGRFKRELTSSLGTTDHRIAKRRDLAEAARVTDLLEEASRLLQGGPVAGTTSAPASYPTEEEIEADVIRGLLDADDKDRMDGDHRRQMQTPEERAQWPDLEDALFGGFGMTDAHLEAKQMEIDLLATDYRQAYARRQIGIVKPELHAYLKREQAPIDPSSPEYLKAGLAMLRGYVKGYDLLNQRQTGSDVPTPPAQPQASAAKGPKLSEAFAHWKAGSNARGGKQPSKNTVAEAERAARYFREWHGDLHLGDIDKPKARDFRNALSKLPTRLPHKVRKLPLRRLIETVGDDYAPAHAATVNKSLNLLAAIVGVCEKDGLLDEVSGFTNPFRNMKIAIDQRHETGQRGIYSDGQLKALFADRIFTAGYRPLGGRGEAAFWFPLIALLTGARLNEIAQLRIADIQKDPDSGIWFIDIGTAGGRSIKTATSRRQVPLHAELIRLGLLKYREALLARKGVTADSSLWPEVDSADEKYRSTAWSKWFNRYLRDTIGVTDKAIVFHSFRHTFKRLARDTGLSEELHDALTGHAGNGGVGRGYGAGFGLRALAEGIGKIAAPESVMAIPAWQASGK